GARGLGNLDAGIDQPGAHLGGGVDEGRGDDAGRLRFDAGGLEVEADEPRGRPGAGVSRSGTVDSRISRGPRIRSRRLCGCADGRSVDVDERGGEFVDGAAEDMVLSGSGGPGTAEA